eukprot:gb/GECH01010541.1/.p1 GENE.gb/GECH01010541.1/~~gb/GECH01010541.1/.p1  ORF type:complete len:136 (+),score=27.37 gb/GECH01010541.1/:1-408(+)
MGRGYHVMVLEEFFRDVGNDAEPSRTEQHTAVPSGHNHEHPVSMGTLQEKEKLVPGAGLSVVIADLYHALYCICKYVNQYTWTRLNVKIRNDTIYLSIYLSIYPAPSTASALVNLVGFENAAGLLFEKGLLTQQQ